MSFVDPRSVRVVIVDDQAVTLKMLTDLLSDWGYTNVVATSDSSQAVDLCRRYDPNLLMLDLHMPAPGGLEVLAELQRSDRSDARVPVLVLTADATEEAKARAFAAGARDFLTKTHFSHVEARLRVRNLIEANLLERQQQAQNKVLELKVRSRTRDLDKARNETLRRLARAGEYRDDDTHEHALRVGRTAALLAERLELPTGIRQDIRHAAPLHDLGKIGISDLILLKPGKLTAEEFDVIKTHSEIGHRLLSGSGATVLELSAEIALTHHERWDGKGYPAGLAGESIPMSGRLVAVADVFDALTHERPYKEAWSVERAVAEIDAMSGSQFCPSVVAAFRDLDHHSLVLPVREERVEPAGGPLRGMRAAS